MVWSLALRSDDAKQDSVVYGTKFGVVFLAEGPRTASIQQPIMRTEDRLFDRGWVRSAMATRKCGNIYFPNFFMAVRPFFTRIFFQELFGLEGSKHFLEKFRQVHNLKISNRLLRSKSFFQKNIPGFICSVCVPFLGS